MAELAGILSKVFKKKRLTMEGISIYNGAYTQILLNRGIAMRQIKKGKILCHCINLRRAVNGVTELYEGYLAPIEISANQFSLLVNLRRLGTGSVSDLANYVGLDRTTLVRTLKPLLGRGLIEDTSAIGQRNRVLQLTMLGEQTVKQGLPLWAEAQDEVERRIGKEKIAELYEILAMLEKS